VNLNVKAGNKKLYTGKKRGRKCKSLNPPLTIAEYEAAKINSQLQLQQQLQQQQVLNNQPIKKSQILKMEKIR
jgi:hypothetical protein